MQTIEYRFIDKSDWPRGPWDDEPDKLQFPDEKTGLPCLIRRNWINGALCGYVGIAPGHRLYGKNWQDAGLIAHRGINYGSQCEFDGEPQSGICHIAEPGEPEHVFWFGFDCMHTGDLVPLFSRPFTPREWKSFFGFDTYRDVAYVKRQCAVLARQLRHG